MNTKAVREGLSFHAEGMKRDEVIEEFKSRLITYLRELSDYFAEKALSRAESKDKYVLLDAERIAKQSDDIGELADRLESGELTKMHIGIIRRQLEFIRQSFEQKKMPTDSIDLFIDELEDIRSKLKD